MRLKIITNQIKCKECNHTITSTNRHDFKYCQCGKVAVDGGKAYLKRTGDPEAYEELSVYAIPATYYWEIINNQQKCACLMKH